MPRLLRLLAPAAGLVLLVAACGGDDDRDSTPTTSTTLVEDPASGDEPDEDAAAEETVPDAAAEDPPAESGGEDEGLRDPAVFVTELDGESVVPGPGDPAATGRMEAESDVDGRLCFDIVVEGLGSEITDAHIHVGAAGERGEVVIPIGPPTGRAGDAASWTGVCVGVDDEVFERMMAEPSRFYANLHSADLPDGAIRGQLELAIIFDRTLS